MAKAKVCRARDLRIPGVVVVCLSWLGLDSLLFSAPKPAEQRFLFCRHGQTTFNVEDRFQGTMNEEPVLTQKGQEQARELGKWLKEQTIDSIDAVFVSPLLRAQHTLELAREVAGNKIPESATTLQELREIELYEWEGFTQPEVKAKSPEQFRQWKEEAWNLCVSGHFVVRDLWKRAGEAWKIMRKVAPSTGVSLIVAHGTLGRAMLGTALGLPEQAFRYFAIKNGEVVEVVFPDKSSSAASGAKWRKVHPTQSPWRSLADEQKAMATSSVEEVDIA